MGGAGRNLVTPELALVDPELAKAQRQILERKAPMSSSTPSNGTFFIDPAQPAPPPVSPELAAVPVPTIESMPAAEPVAPASEPALTAAPAPVPPPAPALVPPAPQAPPPALVDDGSTPMRDVPLGTLIFRAGLLAEEQLEDALQDGMRTGKRLGEVLLERGWLHERDLGRLLAGQKGLPFIEVHSADAEEAALKMLHEEKARLQNALPLRYEDGQLVVAVADPSNELVIENLRRMLGSEPRLVVAPHSELIRAIGEAYAGLGAQGLEPPQEGLPVPHATPQLDVPALEVSPIETPHVEAPQPETPLLETPQVETPPVEIPVEMPVVTPINPQPEAPALDPVAATPAIEIAPAPEVEAPAPAPRLQSPVVIEDEPLVPPPHEEPVPEPQPAAFPDASTPPAPVEPQPAPLEPLLPVAPLQPPTETVELRPAPEPVPPSPLMPPAAEQPQELPATVAEFVAPATLESPATPSGSSDSEPASIHIVLIRLREGESLEVGTFQSASEALACAQEVVRQIATAEGDATWPFFGERYLRPDTIVSVDMLEESAEKWLGSAARTRWANHTATS